MGILVSNAVSETEFFRIAQQTALKLGLKVDYEHEQMAHLGRALTDADRFLDIGANQGLLRACRELRPAQRQHRARRGQS